MLPNLGDAPGLILLFLLFLAGMIVGLALMLKGRAYGFWVLLAGSVLITLMNGAQSGNYTAITSGGLALVVITFFITRKQLGLFVKKTYSASYSPRPTTNYAPAYQRNSIVPIKESAFESAFEHSAKICDVCGYPLHSDTTWFIPIDIFYNSPKYKQWMTNNRLSFYPPGTTVEQVLFDMRSRDNTPGSMVCGDCVGLFR